MIGRPGRALARGRAAAEALMLDTFTAHAHAPAGATRDSDRMDVRAYADRGSTRGKLQSGSTEGGDTAHRDVKVGGVTRVVTEGGLHIPVTAAAPTGGTLGVGWEYELTHLGPFTPADLLGSRWLVVHSPTKTWMTARRLDVVRLT